MSESTYWSRMRGRRLSRRGLLRASARAGVGAAGLALVGCGDDDDDSAAARVQEAQQQEEPQAQQQAAEQQAQQAEAQEQAQAQAQQEQAQQQAVAEHVPMGEVRWPTVQNLSALEATVGTGGDDHQAFWAVHDNLVVYDANLSPDASVSLAQAWEIPDPLNVIFNLRDGVQYHDGLAFSSETVRLHIERGKNLEVSRIKADLDAVENVVEVDRLTASFEMSRPFSPLLLILGDRAGALTSPNAFERISEASSREAPVGTGAFEYEDEDLDGPYIMSAFKDYWMPNAPTVEKLILQQGVDPTQQVNGLFTGEFDVIYQTPSEDQARVLDNPDVASALNPTNGSAHVWLNRNEHPWNNDHLRKAYAFALDRDRLVDVVRSGVGVPNKWGWLGPATGVYHKPDNELVSFDPERVRQELAAGGAPDGFSFKANVLNAPGDVTRAEFHQASLAEFGIEMEIVPRPSPDYYLEFWDLASVTLIAGMSVRADVWQQMAFGHAEAGPMDFSLPADKDPAVQDAFAKVAETFEPEPRVEAMQELNTLITEGAFNIFENFAIQTWGWNPDLQFEIYKDGKPHFGQNNVSLAT